MTIKCLIIFLKKADNKLFFKFNFFYPEFLEKKIIKSGCQSLLDLGCGKDSPIKFFSEKFKYSLGVDNFPDYIKQSKEKKIHSEYLLEDILSACKRIKSKSFDCVLASDLIEHFSKEDGEILIKEMERIAVKKVFIFTPNGFVPQKKYDNNQGQVHLSGWSVGEMRKLKYKVYGIGGLKFIKGEKRRIKLFPKKLWLRIALLSQVFLANYPSLSFQILCVKTLEN